LIGEKKALERGFHGAWRPPLPGGVEEGVSQVLIYYPV
jgi:hypothetical protein